MPALVDLAEHPAIVFGAYIAALVPLTVLYARDFITEKWRTVGETRQTGHLYLICSITPLSFVIFYIHLQRVADYMEMAAATSVAVFSIFHILRTIWGLLQLDAFKQWNIRALRCLNNIGYTAPVYEFVLERSLDDEATRLKSKASGENRRGDSHRGIQNAERKRMAQTWMGAMQACLECVRKAALSAQERLVSCFRRGRGYKYLLTREGKTLNQKELELTIDKHMVVNSSLLDNEFRSSELPCRLKKVALVKATWKLFTQRRSFRVSDHLECVQPVECSVRWLVVFIARFGSRWLTEKTELRKLERYDSLPVEEQKKIFRQRVGVLAALQTTFEKDGDLISVFPPGSPLLKSPSIQQDLRLTAAEAAALPYKCSGHAFEEDLSFESSSPAIREAILGYDHRALSELKSDKRKALKRMGSCEIACFAKLMSSSVSVVPLDPVAYRRAEPSFSISEQIGDFGSNTETEVDRMIPTSIPWHRRSLWKGKFSNESVNQASVYIDNWAALESGRRLKKIETQDEISDSLTGSNRSLFKAHKTLEMRAYQYDLSRDHSLETSAIGDIELLGCVTESVRAFLAHSVAGLSPEAIQNINWRPKIEKKVFPFRASSQLRLSLLDFQTGADQTRKFSGKGPRGWSIETRLLWELQMSFHSAVSCEDENKVRSGGLVACSELMALCILGFPCIEVEKISSNAVDCAQTAQEGTMDRGDARLQIMEHVLQCSVHPVHGPQPIWLDVYIDSRTGDGEVELVVGPMERTANEFDWQKWKDSFMGRLKGQAEWRESKTGSSRSWREEVALESVLSVPIKNIEGLNVYQWGGWPPLHPMMSMISRRGLFDTESPDEPFEVQAAVEYAADRLEKEMRSKASGNVLSSAEETAQALREQAQSAKQEGQLSKAVKLYCESVLEHKDAVALEEVLALFKEKGGDFAKVHLSRVLNCMIDVLHSTIESNHEEIREVGSAAIGFDQLVLCFSNLSKFDQNNALIYESRARCMFELRDGKLLSMAQDNDSKMIYQHDSLLLVAIKYIEQWKRSDDPFMRLMAEGYLERYARQSPSKDLGHSIGYLFEMGILRGRQSFHLTALRKQEYGPDLSARETACHFVAHGPSSVNVVRKSPATAVRIYESMIERHHGERMPKTMNRLGLVYMLGNGGIQDLKNSERRLNGAMELDSKDAMCNLAVLHGFYLENWEAAEEYLMQAVPVTFPDTQSGTPQLLNLFNRPRVDTVLVNGYSYKIWDRSDIRQDPHTSSMNNLAVLYEMEDNECGSAQQALEMYKRIFYADKNPVAVLNMAVLLKLGPTSLRHEVASYNLLQILLKGLPDIEHMPELVKSIQSLRSYSANEYDWDWKVELEQLDDCAVFVKRVYRTTVFLSSPNKMR